jgi:hypothetical protein
MELTECRKERVRHIFDDLRGKNRVSVKKCQRVLGELRFMGAAIPGAAGLFGAMQLGLKHADQHRVRITPYLCDHLSDFEMLAESVSNRPTQLAEVVPDYPSISAQSTRPKREWEESCLRMARNQLCGVPSSRRTSRRG